MLELLTTAERDNVHIPDGDFVKAFVEAQKLKTDAAPFLLEAGALMALSLAAGDTVTAPILVGGDGKLYFNLYIILVGPSTTTRKTTILNSIRVILPTNVHTKENYIVTVDDTSVQAFNRTATEAGQTQSPVGLSLDEVAGVFQATRKGNGYLAGFDSVLLKLYDHSPVHITRTGNGAGSVIAKRGAYICMFAASTPEPLTAALGSHPPRLPGRTCPTGPAEERVMCG